MIGSSLIRGQVRLSYFDELSKAMTILGEDKRTIFLGQSVAYPGNALYKTLSGVSLEKRIEIPVAEELQLGMSIGLSLAGKIPISIYPRFDFLLLAMNQLVNHLDKIEEMSDGEFKTKVIIRTAVGSTNPLDPGIQHKQDYSDGVRLLLKNVHLIQLKESCDIIPIYLKALHQSGSYLIVEYADLYGEK